MERSGASEGLYGLLWGMSYSFLIEPVTGCWLWRGPLTANGYAMFEGRKAHRLIYARLRRPTRLLLHHTCQTKHCVNPDHLWPMRSRDHQRLHKELRLQGLGN